MMDDTKDYKKENENNWRKWYAVDPKRCWTTTLPNFILSYAGLTSISLFRDFYTYYHSSQTEEMAFSLWLRVLDQQSHRPQNALSRSVSGVGAGFATYQSMIKSSKVRSKQHFLGAHGWKSNKFMNELRARNPDGCLADQYRLLLSLFENMIEEKLGDAFMIHHLAMRLLQHFSLTSTSVHDLWFPLFSHQQVDLHTRENLLIQAINRYYTPQFEIIYNTTCNTILNFALPLKETEAVHFNHFRSIVDGTTTFAELDAKSPAIKKEKATEGKTTTEQQQNTNTKKKTEHTEAKEDKTSENTEAKTSENTKKTKRNVSTASSSSNATIVKEYLQMLDDVALQTLPQHLNTMKPCHETKSLYNMVLPEGGQYAEAYRDEAGGGWRLLHGPFNPDDSTNRIAMARTLFRARKMKEWLPLFFPAVQHDIDLPTVLLVSRNANKETKENKENKESKEEGTSIWLQYTYRHIYPHCNHTFPASELSSLMLSHPTPLLVLQLFRSLLGIAENSCFLRSPKEQSEQLHNTRVIAPALMFKMKTYGSYDLNPKHQYPIVNSELLREMKNKQSIYSYSKLFFSTDFLARTKAWDAHRRRSGTNGRQTKEKEKEIRKLVNPCIVPLEFDRLLTSMQATTYNASIGDFPHLVKTFLQGLQRDSDFHSPAPMMRLLATLF